MMTKFRAVSGSSESSRNSESQEDLESASNNNNIGDTKRFNSDDVDYFNLFYKSKFINTALAIEHIDKSTFFRDIHIFVDRVKNVVRAKGDALLR